MTATGRVVQALDAEIRSLEETYLHEAPDARHSAIMVARIMLAVAAMPEARSGLLLDVWETVREAKGYVQ